MESGFISKIPTTLQLEFLISFLCITPVLSCFFGRWRFVGFKKVDGVHYEPLLFNDNSYLKSLTRFFSRSSKSDYDSVISCKLFHERYLIVLTQNCHLKIWDLTSFTLIQDYDMVSQSDSDPSHFRKVEAVGEYLSLYNNTLVTLLPLENGLFQMGTLLIDSSGILTYTFQK